MVFFTKSLLGLLAITMNGINYFRNQNQNITRPCDNELLISLFSTRRPFLFNTRLNSFKPLTTTKKTSSSSSYEYLAHTQIPNKIEEKLSGESGEYYPLNNSDFEINFRLTQKNKINFELIGDLSSSSIPKFEGKLSKDTQTIYLHNVEIDIRKTSLGTIFGDLPKLTNLTLMNIKLLRKSKNSALQRFQILKGHQVMSLFPKLKTFFFNHVQDPQFLTTLKSSPTTLSDILFFVKKIGEFSFENVWDLNVNMKISVGDEKIFEIDQENYQLLSSLNFTNDLYNEFLSSKRIEYNRKALYKKEFCYLQDCGNGNHIKKVELSTLSRISSLKTCCIPPKKISLKELQIVPSLFPQDITYLNLQKVSISKTDLNSILKRNSKLKHFYITHNELKKLELDISNLPPQMASLSLENIKIVNSGKSKVNLEDLTLINVDYPINFETEVFERFVPKNFAFSSSNFSESIERFLRSAVGGKSLHWIHFQNFTTHNENAINFLHSAGIILNSEGPNSFSLKMNENQFWQGKITYNEENFYFYDSLTGKDQFKSMEDNNNIINNLKTDSFTSNSISNDLLTRWKNKVNQNGLKSLQFNSHFDLTSIQRYKNKDTVGLIHMKRNEALASSLPHLFANFTKLEYIFIEDLSLYGELVDKVELVNLKGFYYHEKFMRGNSEAETREYLTKSRLQSVLFFMNSLDESGEGNWDDYLWNLGIDVKVMFGDFTALEIDHKFKNRIISNYHESFNIRSRDDLSNL